MNERAGLRWKRVGGHSLLLSTGLFLAGCASPGTPKPPSLRLPEVVTDLTAERVGEAVRLRWTTPSKTTDGLTIKGASVAQLCRKVFQTATACSPVRRLAARPGPSEVVDILPAALARGTGAVLEYRIELLNAGERSAGLSSAAIAAGGTVPPVVAGLRVKATREGALLRWQPEDAADTVELERSQGSPAAAKPGKRPVPVGSAPQPTGPVRLRADRTGSADTPFVADAGGMLDATAARGESYVYTAQRVRRVVLAGQALEMRSAASAPVKVTMRDVFPPQAPVGLEAIAGESGGVLGIDLSWTPNTEDDLAGYFVYRRGNATEDVRITPSLVLQPGFRDVGVVPGHTYVYSVRAIDRTGNLSAASAAARESTPLP